MTFSPIPVAITLFMWCLFFYGLCYDFQLEIDGLLGDAHGTGFSYLIQVGANSPGQPAKGRSPVLAKAVRRIA
jgi:hypothetical protein